MARVYLCDLLDSKKPPPKKKKGVQILERDVDEVFQKWAFSAEIRNNVRPKTTLKAGADCLIAKVDGPG